jgi:DNA (cytosine-5)-methyltransferase 1
METLTVNELFSGIGAQRKALERLGIDHEVIGICEIDKYAIQSYEAIFGETKNYGDICTAERLNYADLWTYSFPCQDISVAGKQQGINQDTRSGLLYQVQRLLEVAKDEGTLPKYLLLENVKNLVGKQFKSQFEDWLFYLDELGYNTYWQVLNAKNYGIPQNRERVFAVSIRKDLNQTFEFPQIEELKLRLKDVLEDEVDEKYYLHQDKIQSLIKTLENKEISNTIRAGGKGSLDRHQWDLVAVEPKIQQVGNYMDTTSFGGNPQCGRVYNSEGISPTLNTMQGGDRQPKIVIGSTQKNAYIGDGEMSPTLTSVMGIGGGHVPMVGFDEKIIIDDTQGFDGVRIYKNYAPTLRACRSGLKTFAKNKNVDLNVYREMVVKNNYDLPIAVDEQNVTVRKDYTVGTLTTDGSSPKKNNRIMETDFRIRKITPLECWRLMGFDDADFYKAQKSGVSNSQLYKQAGNSIVVNVLEKIFKNLF